MRLPTTIGKSASVGGGVQGNSHWVWIVAQKKEREKIESETAGTSDCCPLYEEPGMAGIRHHAPHDYCHSCIRQVNGLRNMMYQRSSWKIDRTVESDTIHREVVATFNKVIFTDKIMVSIASLAS